MLVLEPSRRYTIEEIKRHRWMYSEIPELSNIAKFDVNMDGTTNIEPNDDILRVMSEFAGIVPEKTKASLKKNSYDHIAAIYLLLQDRVNSKKAAAAAATTNSSLPKQMSAMTASSAAAAAALSHQLTAHGVAPNNTSRLFLKTNNKTKMDHHQRIKNHHSQQHMMLLQEQAATINMSPRDYAQHYHQQQQQYLQHHAAKMAHFAQHKLSQQALSLDPYAMQRMHVLPSPPLREDYESSNLNLHPMHGKYEHRATPASVVVGVSSRLSRHSLSNSQRPIGASSYSIDNNKHLTASYQKCKDVILSNHHINGAAAKYRDPSVLMLCSADRRETSPNTLRNPNLALGESIMKQSSEDCRMLLQQATAIAESKHQIIDNDEMHMTENNHRLSRKDSKTMSSSTSFDSSSHLNHNMSFKYKMSAEASKLFQTLQESPLPLQVSKNHLNVVA